jgi:CRISPR-associated endonuclease/helicase Cas3
MATSSFYDTESYSHPDERLGNHLQRVAFNAIEATRRIDAVFTIIEGDLLGRAVALAAALHDLGKATTYFQNYLLTDEPYDNDLKAHAKISAIVTRNMLSEMINNSVQDPILKFYLPLITFLAVKRHHGNLENLVDENYVLRQQKDIEVFNKQSQSLNQRDIELISRLVFETTGWEKSLSTLIKEFDIKKFVSSIGITFQEPKFRKLEPNKKLEYYFLALTIYSTLLYSDKKDVIIGEKQFLLPTLPENTVENYRSKMGFEKNVKGINVYKENAYFGVLDKITNSFDLQNRIYSITLPTGLGKTLTSLKAALAIKEKLGDNYKLVFTIPFTSIIDQTYTIYSDIFGSTKSDIILKHHHLTEPVYKSGDDTLDINRSEFMIETWDSNVVVTTFVQLFESLITNSKARLLKLPNLAHSIIILDEVQNIPYKYWRLINNTLKVFSRIYDVYFILLTATQPLIFTPGEEIDELVPDYEEYFKIFNRTRLFQRLDEPFDSIEDLMGEIVLFDRENPNKNILVILNTRANSMYLFELLTTAFPEDQLYYLSSSISPYERKIIIEQKIKNNRNVKRKILVSTQLIEAGVDISFDVVFREIAPIDSILQSAGRANRYGKEGSPAPVIIFRFAKNLDKSSLIYGVELINVSKNIITNFVPAVGLEELHYLTLIGEYFKSLKGFSENLECPILNAVEALNFKDIGDFSLISENKDMVSIFLLLNEDAQRVWQTYKEIRRKNIPSYEKKKEFGLIKAVFYDFVINVPVKEKERINIFNKEPEFGFYVWDPEMDDQFYSYSPTNFRLNTGFQKKASAVL